MPAPLLAVDTPSMLFRAFYALPSKIVGTDGRPVNALLGTANLILREVELHQPRAVVLTFGPDAAAYRTELYPAYHAKREEEIFVIGRQDSVRLPRGQPRPGAHADDVAYAWQIRVVPVHRIGAGRDRQGQGDGQGRDPGPSAPHEAGAEDEHRPHCERDSRQRREERRADHGNVEHRSAPPTGTEPQRRAPENAARCTELNA